MELSLLPYQPERDVYQLLGVPPSADAAQIAVACRRLARTFHPDRNGSPQAHVEMQVVNAVRSLLTDPGARAEYDRSRLTFLAHRRAPTRQTPMPTAPMPSAPTAPTVIHPVRPASAPTLGSRDWARTARAVMAGLLAGVGALAPDRCPDCTAPIERGYRFCGECGGALT